MARKLVDDNRGVAHLALIVVGVLIFGAIGFAGYRVMNQKNSDSYGTNPNPNSETPSENIPCETDDKDLCKFFSSWKTNKQYKMVATAEDGSKSTFEIDGDKNRVSMTIDGSAYEVITIGKATYTKAGSVWYKQTIKESKDDVAADYKVDFEEPSEESESKDKTTYKNLGKEQCGTLTCFKYQVVVSSRKNEKEFIWFDDKDYQLRKTRSETNDGVSESTFEYSGVSISEPSPVKELGPNQYIVPGQSEPVTMPDMSQYQQ